MSKKSYEIAFRLGAKMDSSLRTAFASANKNMNQLNRNSGSLTRTTGTLTRSMSSLTGAVGSVTPAVGNMAKRVSGSVTSGLIAPFQGAIGIVKQYAGALGLLSGGALAASGMNRLSAIENAQTSLTVMMGDAGKAKKFMDEVLAFAKTTPFAFPDLAETSRNLIAFGMDEAKVVPTMKAIGDAAAASGKGSEGLRQIASAFGAMQVSGTLSLGEMNRLMDAGIPALKIMANETGISVDRLKKLISKGMFESEESIDMLVRGMQEGTKGIAGQTAAMAGIMEETKKNWTGSVDSLKSSISSTMAKIMEPAKPHIQAAMAWFGQKFSNLPSIVFGAVDKIKPIVKNIAPIFTGAFHAINGLFQAFKGGAGTIEGILIFQKMGLSRNQADNVVSLINSVKDGILSVIEMAKKIGTDIKSYVGENLDDIIAKGISFANSIRDNWNPIINTVIGLGVAVLTFKGIMAGMQVISTINALMKAYKAGTLAATVAQYSLNAAMWLSPTTWIIAGIAAVIAAGVLLWKNWDTVKAKATELWSSTKAVFGSIGNWFSEKWREAKTRSIQAVTSMVASVNSWFGKMKQRIIWTLTEFPIIASEKLGYMVGMAEMWLRQMPSKFATYFGLAKDWAIQKITALPGLIVGFLSDAKTKATTQLVALASGFAIWFTTAKNNALNIVKELPGKIAGFIAEIPSKLAGVISSVTAKFKDLGAAIPRAIAEGFNSAKEGIGKAAKWALDKVSSGFTGISNLGRNVASNFGSGYNSAVDGSHSSGLGRVPFDGYMAELHRNEAVLTAAQAHALRQSGMLKGDGASPSLTLSPRGVENEPVLPLPKLNSFLNGPAATKTGDQFNYKPTFVVQNGANKNDIKDVSQQGFRDFQRWVKDTKSEEDRLAFR